MQGRTTSWDLGSLLIKPVQRVLKYPLLLKEMLVLAPSDHEGHADLVAASQEMQKVADHLNEVKRRHDIVGHIVREPRPQANKQVSKSAAQLPPAGDDSDSSSILARKRSKKKNKKLLFQKQQRSEPMPMLQVHPAQNNKATTDEALMARFKRQHTAAKLFVAQVLDWQASVKTQREALHQLAKSFEGFYGSWGRVHEFSVQTRVWVTERKLESRLVHFISVRLDTLVRLYENPHKVVVELQSCQDEKDAAAIRSQLQEELPRFLELAATYFDGLVGELTHIQADYCQWLSRGWRGLQRPLEEEEDTRTTTEAYLDRMRPVQECLDNIMNAHRSKMRAFYS
ncbi:hypothetical protein BCR43DRAFT_348586 [Syncephalastrum racemosum]|uniref:DH domain-containing protein n=1 Tax=Syncephalastrum racemosum TaxID=13706 RepID=A0A1X2H5Z3_SYNRA|nr:hypothetical protein BCR43DRAFT_348586 [Syncephalastrum racemosum]